MIVVIFTFQCLQRYCEHCFLRFIACSVTASIVFCVSVLAALLRALFFAFQCLQRYCEHCFLRFIACSVTASIVFCVLSLAASLRALFFAFYRLQRYCEHCFLRFIACSVTASIKIFVFIFAERRCVFGMVGAVPVCPPERPCSGVSIPKYICASRIMHEDLTMDAPLQGDTGGHTGTAPTKLHYTHLHHSIKQHHPSTCNPPMIDAHFGHVPTKTIHHLEMNEGTDAAIIIMPGSF